MPDSVNAADHEQPSGAAYGRQLGYQLVKAQLPNQQKTTVRIPTGMTIREALFKALKLRKLEPDMCVAYRWSPNGQTKQQIDWDVDVSMLKGDEIIVEAKDKVPMSTQLSHNFAKSFLTLSKCNFCQEFLLTGIRCLTCGIEFHRNCANSVPKLCEPVMEHNTYYLSHMLARANGFSPTAVSNSDSPTNNNRLIRPRARSADENSKHKSNKVYINNNNNNYSTALSNNNQQLTQPDQTINYVIENEEQQSTPNHNHHNVTYDPQIQSPDVHHPQNDGIAPVTPQQPMPTPVSSNKLNQDNHGAHFQIPPPRDQLMQLSTSQKQFLEEKWEIDAEEINWRERIGQGSFATVYKGTWHGPVALKVLNVKVPTPAQLRDFKNEVVVLKNTRHPNILLFYGYVLKPRLVIVTQWCKGQSLYKHLHVQDGRDYTNCEIKNIVMGIAQGMDYLHAKNIIHRDLKSNNVFIHDEDNMTVKIGDFGLATFKTRYEGDQQIYHPTGSILWMAPEIIKTEPGVNPFTYQSDVYSFGIVIYEMLTRKLPYFDFKRKAALLFLIGLGDPKLSPKLNLDVIKSDKPEGLKSLMLRCVDRESKSRPLFPMITRELKKIKFSRIPRSSSEPLRLNDFSGSFTLDS